MLKVDTLDPAVVGPPDAAGRGGLTDGALDPCPDLYLSCQSVPACSARAVSVLLARHVDDVDAEHEGRTALWEAVFANRPGNARSLLAAGADPWQPMMNSWSPGRLSLATSTPDRKTQRSDGYGEIALRR